jgi:aspartate dehydrogenase
MNDGIMNVALIGLGTIMREVVRHIADAGSPVRIAGALVRDASRARAVSFTLWGSRDELLAHQPALVVECASQAALREHGAAVLAAGYDLIASSVGALADPAVHAQFEQALAVPGAGRLYIPAGAIAGVDALAAAKQVGISTVRYVRRAPPKTWITSGALTPEEAAALKEVKTVYSGSAREAARRFPKNANVAATISLAGIGFERTEVELIADPALTANLHCIRAEGDFGTLYTEASARTIHANTSSSKIVAGSIAHAVLSRVARIAV